MSTLRSLALVAALLVVSADGQYHPAIARTCVAATSCGRQPVQFIPGQRITVEVANLTQSIVQIQQLYATDPLAVNPGQVRSFVRGGNTDPNFCVVLWDAIGLPVKVNIVKADARTLRIEVRPGGRPPGDRTVYLRDDGRVAVF